MVMGIDLSQYDTDFNVPANEPLSDAPVVDTAADYIENQADSNIEIAPNYDIQTPLLNVRDKEITGGSAFIDEIVDPIEGFGSSALDAGLGTLVNLIANEVNEGIEAGKNVSANNLNPDGTLKQDFTDTLPRNIGSRILNPRSFESMDYLFDTDSALNIAIGQGRQLPSNSVIQQYYESAGTGAGFMGNFTAMNMYLVRMLSKIGPQAQLRVLAQLQANAPMTLAASKKIPEALKPFAESVKKLPAGMQSTYITSPATAIGVDIGLGAAGGIGQKVEQDVFGTTTGLGFMAGSFSPLILTPMMAALYNAASKTVLGQVSGKVKSFVTGTYSNIKDSVTRYRDPNVKPSEQTSKSALTAKSRLGKQIKAAIDENPENVRIAREVEETIEKNLPESQVPGPDDAGFPRAPRLTVAETTRDPVLLQTEAQILSKSTPEEVSINNARIEAFDEGIQNFQNNIVSDNLLEDAPAFVVNTIGNRNTQLLGKIADEIAETEATIGSKILQHFPSYGAGERAAVGSDVRTTVIQMREVARKQMDDLAETLGINTADPVAPASRIATAQKNIEKQILQKEGTEALSYEGVNPLIKRFLEFRGNLTFQDWKAFRDQIGNEIGKAVSFGNGRAQQDLFAFRELMDTLAKGYGSTNKKFQKFNEQYAKEFTGVFDQGGVFKITQKGRGSVPDAPVYVTPNEAVLGTFLRDTSRMKEFTVLAEKNPALFADMRSAILNEIALASGAVNGGKVNIRALNNHLNKNQEVYAQSGVFPEIANNVQILEVASQRVVDLANRATKIESNHVVKALQAAHEGYRNVDEAFDTAIQSPRNFMNWVRQVKKASNETGVDLEPAFRKVIIEKMIAKKPKSTTFTQYLNEIEPILTGLVRGKKYGYDKQHIDDLKMLAAMYDINDVLKTQQTAGAGILPVPGLAEALAGKIGMSPAQLTSLTRALQENRISKPFFAVFTATRTMTAANKNQQLALLKEAMTNPEVARQLMSISPNGVFTAAQEKFMQGLFFRLGFQYSTAKAVDETEALEPPSKIEIRGTAPREPDVFVPEPFVPSPNEPSYLDFMENNTTPTPTPTPVASNQPRQNLGIEELFPFDSTSAAIAKRRNANQGIAGLV